MVKKAVVLYNHPYFYRYNLSFCLDKTNKLYNITRFLCISH